MGMPVSYCLRSLPQPFLSPFCDSGAGLLNSLSPLTASFWSYSANSGYERVTSLEVEKKYYTNMRSDDTSTQPAFTRLTVFYIKFPFSKFWCFCLLTVSDQVSIRVLTAKFIHLCCMFEIFKNKVMGKTSIVFYFQMSPKNEGKLFYAMKKRQLYF